MGDADWTIDRHLDDKPAEVVALYRRFIAMAEACGPFTSSATKTAITLKGARRGFAGVGLTRTALDGHLDLQRRVEDRRIRRSAPYTERLYVHHFRVLRLDDLDEEFGGRLQEAYEVGQGAHLTRPAT